jgi:hypothetical protein
MNIHTFNSRELDVIYDAMFAHMGCTDDEESYNACYAIIEKMHTYSVMNQDEV